MERKKITEDKYFIYSEPEIVGGRYLLRHMLYPFQCIYYKILLNIVKPRGDSKKKYKVSICAIFKDEAPYLKEWIEFHRIVGVEHFFLYNNKSSDDYLDILTPYIDEGIVSLKDWPQPQSQMAAYKDFMENNAHETKWVGFIDLDEFVVPMKYETIYEFLSKYNKRPSVIIYWKFFGTSGRINRDIKSLVTEDFYVAWPKYVNIGKYFFNTEYEYSPDYHLNDYMHKTWGKLHGIHLPAVNVFDRICTLGCNSVPSDNMPIQINHYVIKSYEEYIQKKAKRGGGVHPLGMHDLEYFYYHERNCQSADYSAYNRLIELKLAMKGHNRY